MILCLFTGVYDRYSHLTNHWTGLKITQIETKDYLLIDLKHQKLAYYRRQWNSLPDIFHQNIFPKLFFDTDILSQLKLSRHSSLPK